MLPPLVFRSTFFSGRLSYEKGLNFWALSSPSLQTQWLCDMCCLLSPGRGTSLGSCSKLGLLQVQEPKLLILEVRPLAGTQLMD